MDKQTLELAEKFYSSLATRVTQARNLLQRPLTLAEKILFAHFVGKIDPATKRGADQLRLKPDRVAMQDATAQMALQQFIVCGRDTVELPSSIHCDHLILARHGAVNDLKSALSENKEVYDFLSSAAQRYGIDFWKPGSGIIHQVVLEQYAFPGGLILGTDSHTPNAGGLGMLAIGVGGADAVEVMAGQPWTLRNPKLIGVKLTGRLSGWAAAKDVILKVAGLLTVKGGTGKIVEYFGPGCESISCTGKATITNMGAELGATTSVFPYDERMGAYLKATERAPIASLAQALRLELQADPAVQQNPKDFYDEVLEIDLSSLESQWVGPHTPDLLRTLPEMKTAIKDQNYPDQISYALIGSCTNSSYEDITRAASIARQAKQAGLKTKIPLLITPGSDQILKTIQRDGFVELFEAVGAQVLANACGPCIGQWKRDGLKKGDRNTIITSYNRNFAGRNDGNADTLAFIGSPELVTAVAFAGRLSFDPQREQLDLAGSEKFKFAEPQGVELPEQGFEFSRAGLLSPAGNLAERKKIQIAISPTSERLSFLEAFPPWDGKDFIALPVLLKAKGKCTTDHISPAGPWLRYRGHLARISANMFCGAVNAFSGEVGKGRNVLTGEQGIEFHKIAESYKERGQGWVVIGDENYGEGSSREHAAMSPRFLGCLAVITKSFARIHETNLKRQGVLPLTFVDPKDYDRVGEHDRLSIVGITELAAGRPLKLIIDSGGAQVECAVRHTLTAEEIAWFKAGSALNVLKPH